MALRGSQRRVLQAALDLQDKPGSYVEDERIHDSTRIPLPDLRNWLVTLEEDGLVSLSRTTAGLSVHIESRGRLALADLTVDQEKNRRTADLAQSVKIVPKGLRSFDEGDKDFFLQLLPGPFRNGLPESIHFWKTRIEEQDPEKTFKVGVIIGPSGCGKTSLVNAGLIPRLADHVAEVYVEATSDDTEARLLKGLRKACPDLPANLEVAESIDFLRADKTVASGRKLVLIIDQFEQWLQARREVTDVPLLDALRNCDGDHVQTVLMVRDDFSMALHRFLKLLGIRLEEGTNFAFFDLFDLDHSKSVLIKYGQAFGKLPDNPDNLDVNQRMFLEKTVAELAQDGRVVSVRLALFAEMVKGDPWTPTTLEAVGGTQVIGVNFLEKSFGSPKSNPAHWRHQNAARMVLKILLPEAGTSIKGNMKSREALLDASGYWDRNEEFEDLLRVLNGELRLITPTDPEGVSDEVQLKGRSLETRWYQLTHDYLVSSIREWLTSKQRETRAGRAELLLEERSSYWNAKPERRHLPSILEWVRIRVLTNKRDWTEPQRMMMGRASRLHRNRMFALALLIGLITWVGLEGYGNLRAAALIDSLKSASMTDVPPIIAQLEPYRRWAARPLDRLLASSENQDGPHLRASLASLALWPGERKQRDYLEARLLSSSPVELPVIWKFLRKHERHINHRLRSLLEDSKSDPERRFRAACALANSVDPLVEKHWDAVGPFVTDRFLTAVIKNPSDYSPLIETLRPIRRRLVPSLAMIFRDTGRSESERNFATTLLSDYASDEPSVMANLLMDADAKEYATLFPVAERQRLKTIPIFLAEIGKKADPDASEKNREEIKDRLAERQARAAVALARMGKADQVWALLKHSPDPRLRSLILNWLNPLGTAPRLIAAKLNDIDSKVKPSPAPGQQAMEAILFHPETSMRRALILALGTYGTKGLSPKDRGPLIPKLLELYRNDPDSGIHGASEWTLRQWDQKEMIKEIDAELMRLQDRGNRRWFVNKQGQTFSVIESPIEFVVGSPISEPDRSEDESLRRVQIDRRFAIATTEVSVEQFRQFGSLSKLYKINHKKEYSPYDRGPQIEVSWYAAAAYCNWLSKQEGLEPCYSTQGIGSEEVIKGLETAYLKKSGYRLPNEEEWEFACRAGAITTRPFGRSDILMDKYAWYHENSGYRAMIGGSLIPNDLGLFDFLGNVWEWTNDVGVPEENEKCGTKRILRSGGYTNLPRFLRAAKRFGLVSSYNTEDIGFRLARTMN